MSKQQLIELQTEVDGQEMKFTGRFLGFIKDDEFNALVKNVDKVANRIESKATQPIVEVASKFDEIVGHRLVMTVRKVDDKNVQGKQLFITEGLTVIDSVVPKADRKWDGQKAKYVGPTPGKVTFQAGENNDIVVWECE